MDKFPRARDFLRSDYFPMAEAKTPIEENEDSSVRWKDWNSYPFDNAKERLWPVQVSKDKCISDADEKLQENSPGVGYGEAPTYHLEGWDAILGGHHEPGVAQSTMCMDEPLSGNSFTLEADVTGISSEPWMYWPEWSKLMDDQLSKEQVSQQEATKQICHVRKC